MKTRLTQIVFIISVLLVTVSCTSPTAFDRRITDIQQRLDDYLVRDYQAKQFPGIQYLIFNKDKLLYAYSGGYAKVAAQEKMTPESVLNTFSTTKVITGIAILQLAQQGKIQLVDKVAKHYPQIPFKEITIEQVLSHSSGMTNALLGNFFVHWEYQHKNYDRDSELLEALNDNDLNFKPGTEIGYSNMAYAVLGKVIENVSGLKYEEYITKNIFEPLQLNKNKINFESQSQPNSALPYYKRYSMLYGFLSLFLKGSETKAEGDWTSLNGPFYFNHPAHGGIVASAYEYAKIFMDLMKGKDSKLLSAEMINKMFSKQIEYDDETIAISWFMNTKSKHPYFYHQGSGLGYVAEVRIYPNEKIGSLIFMNRTEYDALQKITSLDGEFLEHIHAK